MGGPGASEPPKICLGIAIILLRKNSISASCASRRYILCDSKPELIDEAIEYH